jgi:hypothetical protein
MSFYSCESIKESGTPVAPVHEYRIVANHDHYDDLAFDYKALLPGDRDILSMGIPGDKFNSNDYTFKKPEGERFSWIPQSNKGIILDIKIYVDGVLMFEKKNFGCLCGKGNKTTPAELQTLIKIFHQPQ